MTEPRRQLLLSAGAASEAGRRPRNDDSFAFCCGPAAELQRIGQLAVIADGVGSSRGGGVAASLCTSGFVEGFYAQGGTRGVQQTAAQIMSATNSWIHSLSRRDQSLEHAACTFSALVLRGRTVHVLHAGDSRIYQLSGDRLTCLTEDHTHSHPDLKHVLYRAVGLEATLRLDYSTHHLREHDRFLLCSDGVHGYLSEQRLRELLQSRGAPQEDSARMLAAALAAGSEDNVTALIVDVLQLPEAQSEELLEGIAALPLRPAPKPGERIDGFLVETQLASGRYSILYKCIDEASGRTVVLKFPQPAVANAATYLLAFTREAWVAARARSPFVGEVLELARGRQTQLYSAMPFHDGETLEQRLLRHPPIGLQEGIRIALQLCRALVALHRAGIVHRDVKPENIMLGRDGGLKLIDLGVARLPRMEDFPSADIPGTPSYMAPELLQGAAGDELSDQFAAGVTLYRAFTRQYPYGEVEAFSRPRFGQPVPLTRYRPDLPAWLDHLISRSLRTEPAQRFGDMIEMTLELDGAQAHGQQVVTRRLSLYERNPLRFWQAASALLLLALVVSLALRHGA